MNAIAKVKVTLLMDVELGTPVFDRTLQNVNNEAQRIALDTVAAAVKGAKPWSSAKAELLSVEVRP